MSPPTGKDPVPEHDAEQARSEPAGTVAPAALAGPAGRDQSFPKSCRILRRAEFLRIQGQGQRIHGKRLVFQFLSGNGRESRVGITVSKKVGNAVVRNRIKRWIREAIRRHPELRPRRADPQRTYDLVITAKRDATGFAWQPLHDEIVAVIGRWLADRARAGDGRERGPRPPRAPQQPPRAPVVREPPDEG